MERFGQGSTVYLDIYIYEFAGGPLKDPDGWNNANPLNSSEPLVKVKDVSRTIVQQGIAKKISTGHFYYEYDLPDDANVGYWSYTWDFLVNGQLLPEGERTETFEVVPAGSVSFVVSALVDDLRILLKDTHPDENKRRYKDEELKLYLEQALLDINVQPPAFTDFTLDDYYNYVPEWKGLIIKGGMVFALISEGIFQIGIEFNYSDNGININTDKSGKYQTMSNMILMNYQAQKEDVKKQYMMKTIKPRALLSAPLSIKVRTMSPRQWRYR